MRLRSLLLIFVAAFLVLLVARLPLSVVLARAVPAGGPLAYGGVEGTVWDGHVRNVRLRGVPLGDADLALSPLSLVTLSPSLDWRLGGGAVTGRGELAVGLADRTIRVRDTDIAADLDRLPTMVPLSGVFAASVRTFEWQGRACRAADVDLRTSALNRNPMGLDWQGPTLTGQAACNAGNLIVSLAGKDASSDLDLKGTVTPEMTYALDVVLKTDNRDLRRSLAGMGFAQGKDGFTIHFEGLIGVDPSDL